MVKYNIGLVVGKCVQYLSDDVRVLAVPVSQFVPVNPLAHVQVYVDPDALHVPSF